MQLPIQRQILDLRSGITMEVKEVLAIMSIQGQDAVGPFMQNQMVTIIEQLNNGNKVIFGHVDDAMRRVSGWVFRRPPKA